MSLMSSLKSPEREIKVVRPLYSVEVTETETAKFETEISESDIHATWKLRGEALHPSAVRLEPDSESGRERFAIILIWYDTRTSPHRMWRLRRREPDTF